MAFRQTTRFFESLLRLIGLNRTVPDFSTLSSRQKILAVFLLVPQVKLPKRLDLARDADRALDSVPELVVANWLERRY